VSSPDQQLQTEEWNGAYVFGVPRRVVGSAQWLMDAKTNPSLAQAMDKDNSIP
jgi:hypothetical protein